MKQKQNEWEHNKFGRNWIHNIITYIIHYIEAVRSYSMVLVVGIKSFLDTLSNMGILWFTPVIL